MTPRRLPGALSAANLTALSCLAGPDVALVDRIRGYQRIWLQLGLSAGVVWIDLVLPVCAGVPNLPRTVSRQPYIECVFENDPGGVGCRRHPGSYQARHIAAATRHLSFEQASVVDANLAPALGAVPWGRLQTSSTV